MRTSFRFLLSMIMLFTLVISAYSQEKEEKSPLSSSTFSGFELRNVGPAMKSGRIADIVIHPEDNSIWYIAVGSGGVWKTVNAGTTWKPIFDKQKVYSIGCISIDPNNPHTIWVGTGENVGGRHVGVGDGVYKSDDDGASWTNMGLKESQHISKIIIHPENSDIIWVAAQGPLWNKGGERGLYLSKDGGKTWEKTLGDDEWVGVTDIIMDPRNPDLLYAATWQRHRNVAAYMGGGPGSAIHRSTDGGATWIKLKKGLPSSNVGKIGLAISPQKPDIIYAAIELDRRTGGIYRSVNRGASWQKMSSTVSGATGPHYYQELVASPHQFDKIYLLDVRVQVSEDGGKTFQRMKERNKHSDNHAMTFRSDDPDYLLVGTDGGLYESYDDTKTWRYIDNLPVTQFYKVAVNNAWPFYQIIGGTQDNGTQMGVSQTDQWQGITNADWTMIYGGDGHQPATEPGNNDIVYCESQQGYLARVDLITGESVSIRPQPLMDEQHDRFNWDSPILVSPHSPTRIYFASQRIWRSDDRGDSWTPISEDLSRDQQRLTLPIMDQTWSWDATWDVDAMSQYNTITSLAESPLKEGLIYAGTDDGLIQISDDGGENWNEIEVGSLPGVPATAFVNDIKADLYDESTVYVALDNHKFGDLKSYLLKSTDKGKSWKSIAGDMPENHLVWRIVQDVVKPELMFAATEYGIFFTIDGGEKWIKLKGGVPTISFRDLVIQKERNDLVCASFGRGFFILDDINPLREVTEEKLKEEASLYPVRDAWQYTFRLSAGSQGAGHYTAKNPEYGAVITYHLTEGYTSKESKRKKKEAKLIKDKEPLEFPEWEVLKEERLEEKPKVWLTIKDEGGLIVRKISAPAGKGFHRVAWDLRYPAWGAIDIHQERSSANWTPGGTHVLPGTYSVTISKEVEGRITELGGAVEFNVIKLYEGALTGKDPVDVQQFKGEIRLMREATSAASIVLGEASKKLNGMQTALSRMSEPVGELYEELYQMKKELAEFEEQVYGDPAKRELSQYDYPTVMQRWSVAAAGANNLSYGPTNTQVMSLEIARDQFTSLKTDLELIVNEQLPALEQKMIEAGAPWMNGMPLK
ncbi:MAG: glycosyl hydrolase [Bacteroidota bacterium]